MIATYLNNLRAVYQRASDLQIAEGRLWYPNARGELFDIARRYRISLKRVAYAAAALSNNKTWQENVALAEHVAYSVTAGVEARGHFTKLIDKAVRILQHGDFAALSGPKVEPFARAILGDRSAAVVDRWIWRAAWGESPPHLTHRRLTDVAVALRMLAREVKQPVAEVQAIVWLVIRD